jgi:hypothetical protein
MARKSEHLIRSRIQIIQANCLYKIHQYQGGRSF